MISTDKQGSLGQLAVPAGIFLPIAIALSSWALGSLDPLSVGGLIAVGLVIWTLVEYVVHRALFHLESHTSLGQRIVYVYHGRHHDFPTDTSSLTMSPGFTLPAGALFYGCFWLLAGPMAAAALFAGLAIGYICYETVHFLVHAGCLHHLRLMKSWRRYHFGHHYRDESAAYGVTTPLWDFVFGTRD